jgi:glycosyltransferase involved in cell wall biosynthesis
MIDRKQSLIFLIPSLSFGGAEVMMVQQIRWLTAHGWNVYAGVLSQQIETGLVKSLCLPEDHIFCSAGASAVLNASAIKYAVQHQAELHGFIKKHEIGVVIANMPLAHLWGRLVKLRNSRLRLLIYHHATQYRANPLNTLTKIIFNKLQEGLAKRTDDLTICISDAVREDIATHFTIENGHVLFNSVENRRQEIGERLAGKVHCTRRKKVSMIIPGRLHSVKGHLFFLKVFCQMRQQGIFDDQPVTLMIAGGGPMEGEIRSFIQLQQLEDCVTLTGTVDNETLLEYMHAADLVVIPSIEEGLGIVAIEALMLGKTIISSNAGGLKEVIRHGENGYLFHANDTAQCLDLCTAVLTRFPFSLLPEAALIADYEKRFSFEHHMQSLTTLLKSLI